MAKTDQAVLERSERDQVVDWRLGELLAAGYEHDDAVELADALEVDLHAAVELPRTGCPHAVAARILL